MDYYAGDASGWHNQPESAVEPLPVVSNRALAAWRSAPATSTTAAGRTFMNR